MKKHLAIIFTIVLGVSCFFVLYNYFDKKDTYDKLFSENKNLIEHYQNLETIIAEYENKIEGYDQEQNELLNYIATNEKEIEIVSSDIDKIIEGLLKEDSIEKKAYLTFDDGPSQVTAKILDLLKEYGVKATFFVNGKDDAYSKMLYKRIVDEGHSIGNHTYVHSYKRIYASVDAFTEDFVKLQKLIEDTTGRTMDIMRFPGGSNNTISNHYSRGIMNKLTSYCKDIGYQYFDWNVSAGDSRSRRASVRTITNNVLKGSRGKTNIIILMHDSRYKKNTLASLPNIIKSLQERGFKLLPLTSSSPNVQFK